jgi:hypothetical protein
MKKLETLIKLDAIHTPQKASRHGLLPAQLERQQDQALRPQKLELLPSPSA